MNKKYRSALIRSGVILIILVLSVAVGFAYQKVSDALDRKSYPREYSDIVTKYSAQYGVPENVIYAVIRTESSFDSGAKSSAGALGLMQIMPSTFDWLVTLTQENYETGMLYDPETNIKYGTYLLSYLYLRYGDWDTVFAAYNGGASNVDKWLADTSVCENGKLVNIPIGETADYVKKVSSSAEKYKELYYDN